MVIINTVGGLLGASGFRNSYYINIIGFLSMMLIAICLPDTGTVKVTNTEKITLTKEVFRVSFFGMLEFLFLITFTTNIAMHLSGSLAGDTTVSGNLTGIFSGSQIVAGIILGGVTRITKRYTLPAAMFSFTAGAVLLTLFPSGFLMLAAGAMLCGLSQGIFVPTAMVEASNAVKANSVAMASAVFTCAMSLGQLISPTLLNTAARTVFGEANTTYVYLIAAAGMAIAASAAVIWKKRTH